MPPEQAVGAVGQDGRAERRVRPRGGPGGHPHRPAAVRRSGRPRRCACRPPRGTWTMLRPAGRLRGGPGAGGPVQGVSGSEAGRPAGRCGEVAKAVAELRQAADERARQAELDKVRVEGEQVAAEARSAERRKRHRVWIGAAGLLVVTAIGGLAAVLAVQRQANADLEVKNSRLADEQAKVEKRFELAQEGDRQIAHWRRRGHAAQERRVQGTADEVVDGGCGVLRRPGEAVGGAVQARSRKTLAAAYFQLGELMEQVGSRPECGGAARRWRCGGNWQCPGGRRDAAGRGAQPADGEPIAESNGRHARVRGGG